MHDNALVVPRTAQSQHSVQCVIFSSIVGSNEPERSRKDTGIGSLEQKLQIDERTPAGRVVSPSIFGRFCYSFFCGLAELRFSAHRLAAAALRQVISDSSPSGPHHFAKDTLMTSVKRKMTQV